MSLRGTKFVYASKATSKASSIKGIFPFSVELTTSCMTRKSILKMSSIYFKIFCIDSFIVLPNSALSVMNIKD